MRAVGESAGRRWLGALFVGACTSAFLVIAGCAAAYLINLIR